MKYREAQAAGQAQEQQQLLEVPEEIQVQGIIVQKVTVPRCWRWQSSPGGVSSLEQPKHLNPTSGKLNWGQ